MNFCGESHLKIILTALNDIIPDAFFFSTQINHYADRITRERMAWRKVNRSRLNAKWIRIPEPRVLSGLSTIALTASTSLRSVM